MLVEISTSVENLSGLKVGIAVKVALQSENSNNIKLHQMKCNCELGVATLLAV